MHHAASGRTQRASRAAYDAVWAEDGWVLVGDVVEQPALEEEKPLEKMKVDELKAYAEQQGIDLGGASKKAEILEAIAAHQDETDDDEDDEPDGSESEDEDE